MTKESKKFIQQYYRAMVDSMLLLLKTNLILNSGALVSILIALSRSNINGFSLALTDSAYYFWWGLFAAIISILTFNPVSPDIKEFNNYWEKYKPLAVISALTALAATVAFLVGTRSMISSLKTLFVTG